MTPAVWLITAWLAVGLLNLVAAVAVWLRLGKLCKPAARQQYCTRKVPHVGPCNGLPRYDGAEFCNVGMNERE